MPACLRKLANFQVDMTRDLANFQCFGVRAKKCNARVFLAAGVPEWSTSGSALYPGVPPTVCHPTVCHPIILCLHCGLCVFNGRATSY